MDLNKPTIAIYGVNDISNTNYPTHIHDHSVCIYINGEIAHYIHLERVTRNKYDNALPKRLKPILKKLGYLNPEKFDLIFVDNIIGRSFLNEEGNIRFEAPLNSEVLDKEEEGRSWWFNKHHKSYILNHELAHIFSCLPFYREFKENSLLVHFDGGASLSNVSSWHWKNDKIEKIEANWRLKELSSLFNSNALAFHIIGANIQDQNSVPGKLMGFASFGNSSPELIDWLTKHNYFTDIWKNKQRFFDQAEKDFGIKLNSFDQHNSFIQDIAACFQKIFEDRFIAYLTEMKEKTGSEYLYLTGGSALNIVCNTRIIREKLFKDLFIPPCTNDSGLSIGAGAYLEFKKHGKIKSHSSFLNNYLLPKENFEYDKEEIKKIAEELSKGKILATCNNYGEAGPRALGNRSILALANSKELAQKLSVYHKKREWYRPVAPIMLEKNTRYFTETDSIHHLSKYMLLDFPIPENKRKELEGATHANNTARIQTIFGEEDNPFIYQLLNELNDTFEVKALLNTSFNAQGEPIVHGVDNAFQSAKNMELDGVIINGKLHLF